MRKRAESMSDAVGTRADVVGDPFAVPPDRDVELVGLLDPGRNTDRFLGLQVVGDLGQAETWDAILLTDIARPQARYDELVATVPAARILAPPMLRVAPRADRS